MLGFLSGIFVFVDVIMSIPNKESVFKAMEICLMKMENNDFSLPRL